ncbi:MAG: M20 aminoacylase family protein [Pseudomonadota bacterium]
MAVSFLGSSSSSLSANSHAELTALRRKFHAMAELGFDEHNTSDLVCETLDKIGIPYERGIGGTGVVATLSKGEGTRIVGFRADMDALPINEATNLEYRSRNDGVMHACGHDGHTTMLLGAAQALAADDTFNGTVRFIFQPAEEHGKGAIAMMDDGLFERFPVDAVYGLHNMPTMETGQISMNPGPIMGAEDNFVIKVIGRGGHAAIPNAAKDAMTIGASIVIELQTIVSRNVHPLHGAVVSCTEFLTDGAVNVIPTEVTIKGDTRSFLPEVSELIENRMHQIVKGICTAHDTEYEFSYTRVFPSTVNTPDETQHAANAAASTVGSENTDDNCTALMASEDFGAMLQKRPGCYAFIGNRGKDGKGGIMLHNAAYDFNDDIIPTGVDYWVNLARQTLPDE